MEPVAHFGLGQIKEVAKIEIVWPDGSKKTLQGPIKADQMIKIQHPSTEVRKRKVEENTTPKKKQKLKT